jgi:hypothetical protein
LSHSRRRPTLQNDEEDNDDGDEDDNDFGDDFDDFEEGAQAGADDDFGDFGDGFQKPEAEADAESPVSSSQNHYIPTETFVSSVVHTVVSYSLLICVCSSSALDRIWRIIFCIRTPRRHAAPSGRDVSFYNRYKSILSATTRSDSKRLSNLPF